MFTSSSSTMRSIARACPTSALAAGDCSTDELLGELGAVKAVTGGRMLFVPRAPVTAAPFGDLTPLLAYGMQGPSLLTLEEVEEVEEVVATVSIAQS